MGTDSRQIVTLEGFDAPYDSIGMLLTTKTGVEGFVGGTGFMVGSNTVLTAWHVLAPDGVLADATVFTPGTPNVSIAPTIPMVSPTGQLKKIQGSTDLGLIVNPTTGVNVITGAQDPSIFGLDAFEDYENYLAYLETKNAQVEATTAGFPQIKYQRELLSDDLSIGKIVAGVMYSATGVVDEVTTYNGRQFVSDVPFELTDNRLEQAQPNDGTLDASVGQSGGPLWTYDARNDSHRAMAVAITATNKGDFFGKKLIETLPFYDDFTYDATIFEVIDTDAFSWITNQMVAAGATQPDDVTNRVTGVFDNTYNEFLNGSAYRDVMRGLSTGEGGADYLRGGYGNDIYEVEYGFGQITISEPEHFYLDAVNDKLDTIDFRGIALADVRLERGFQGSHLYIYVKNPDSGQEDLITVGNQFSYVSAIERLQFDEGYIDLTNGLILAGDDADETLDGSGFDDVIFGFGGNDTLLGRGGNDILNGAVGNDILYGGLGDDIYEYGAGYDADGISEEGGFDTVKLLDLDFSDIRLQRDIGVNSGFLNLYVHDGSFDIAGQKIGFGYQFTNNTATQTERLITADNVEIDLTGGLYFRGTDGVNSMAGTEHEDYIETLDGNDTIRAGGGDDFLEGGEGNDQLQGGYGGDTYVFGPGFGQDTISEIGRYFGGTDIGAIDTILFEGISPASLRYETDFLRMNLTIYVGEGTENYVYIPSQYQNYNANGSPLIERISFSGGATIDLSVAGALDNAIPEGEGLEVEKDFGEVETFQITDLLGTVTDADPDAALSFVGTSDEVGGSTVIENDQVIFTPDEGFSGQASFNYLISDGFAVIPVAILIAYGNSLLREFSDGRVLETLYSDGARSQATMTDTEDAFNWSDYVETFDTDGQRTERLMTYDNGKTEQVTYEDGVRAQSAEIDNAGRFAWDTIFQTFDESGQRTNKVISYGNGRDVETNYANGRRTAVTTTDVSDTRGWASVVEIYNAEGVRTDRNTSYDNGRVEETEYNTGVRSQSIVRDLSDLFAWTTSTQLFDAAGKRVAKVVDYDNGRLLETVFENGRRAEAVMSDVDDAFGWTRYTDIFDATGARESRTTLYDDGREEFVSYLDDLGLG